MPPVKEMNEILPSRGPQGIVLLHHLYSVRDLFGQCWTLGIPLEMIQDSSSYAFAIFVEVN